MNLSSLRVRRPLVRELLIFLAFVAITAIITWPWILQLRDGVPDPGDPYSISYFLWWDYHQTFRDPLNLFHATIFYPYRYSLAFGEYDYGVSLLFFPLFAIGLRPLTVYSVAAFLSFPFTAYGTFRLARTLSGSYRAAWIAGIALAFVPFRFHHLAHLHLIFAGWIPLLFEALVLYARARSWRRAAWLGVAFLMNALTCTTWLIITAIPLALSGLLLATRHRLWRERNFWIRAAVTLSLASLLLLPFLLPYRQVAKLNGFVRSPAEVLKYSAKPVHWLSVDERNKVWRGLGASVAETEMVLFPGLLAPLLALAALLFANSRRLVQPENAARQRQRSVLIWLDAAALSCGVLAIMAIGFEGFRLRPFGYTVLTVTDTSRCFFLMALALITRSLIAYPVFLRNLLNGDENLVQTIRERSETMSHGLLWLAIGFIGSFGLNSFFHRVLYDFVPGFQSMRVASRWAMVAYFGLALLAGVGAEKLVSQFRSRRLEVGVYALIVVALAFELNVAPLKLMRGEVDPDELTLFLRSQNMVGGIVELPTGDRNNLYMLRAADHGKPLVNAHDSFVSPLSLEVESLTHSEPIPDRFMDLLEATPVSYLTVHNAFIPAEQQTALASFLSSNVAAGRMRFVRTFTGRGGSDDRKDVYAVTRTEPNAVVDSASAPPSFLATQVHFPDALQPYGLPLMKLYRAAYGRMPSYSEFNAATKRAELAHLKHDGEFAELVTAEPEFVSRYGNLSDEEFLAQLILSAGLVDSQATQSGLLAELRAHSRTRAGALLTIANHRQVQANELNAAFILVNYFVYQHRDADEGGYNFWLQKLDESGDYQSVSDALRKNR